MGAERIQAASGQIVEQILKLQTEGLQNVEIAQRFGLTVRIEAMDIYCAKQQGYDVPPRGTE
jgi:hypothetical protein